VYAKARQRPVQCRPQQNKERRKQRRGRGDHISALRCTSTRLLYVYSASTNNDAEIRSSSYVERACRQQQLVGPEPIRREREHSIRCRGVQLDGEAVAGGGTPVAGGVGRKMKRRVAIHSICTLISCSCPSITLTRHASCISLQRRESKARACMVEWTGLAPPALTRLSVSYFFSFPLSHGSSCPKKGQGVRGTKAGQ
jgi:hypothetical protein